MQTADIDRSTLRRLADLDPEPAGVVSLYVNLDPTRFATPPSRATEVRSLLDEASRRLRGEELPHEARRSLAQDVERLDDWFRGRNFAIDGARGLAIFCSGATDLFEVMPLPFAVESRVHLGERPLIEPLAEQITPGRWCVLLVNRREARILRGGRDRLVEVERISDDVHGQHDQGGWSQARYQRSVEKDVGDHLRNAGEALLRRFRRRPFDWLLLGGPVEAVTRMEGELHTYLRERLAGRIDCDVENTTADDVLRAAEPVLREHDERRADEALARLEQGLGRGDGAVTGIGPTLEALNERRVERLLFERGFSCDGVVCRRCGWVGPSGGDLCPADGAELDARDDVFEAAIELAIRQDADVVALEPEPPRLAEHGGIAAVLRF